MKEECGILRGKQEQNQKNMIESDLTLFQHQVGTEMLKMINTKIINFHEVSSKIPPEKYLQGENIVL